MRSHKNRSSRKIISVIIMILLTIAEAAFIIVNVCKTNAAKNAILSLPTLSSETEVRNAMKEDARDVIISNAPLSGTAISDYQHILTERFDIPSDQILYVNYMVQEYEDCSDEDGTSYEWVSQQVDYENTSQYIYLYDDIKIELDCYRFMPKRTQYYKYEGTTNIGDRRYLIRYLTTEDTLTCKATVGNDMLIIRPFDDTSEQVIINGSVGQAISNVNEGLIVWIIVTAFAYIILMILAFARMLPLNQH